MPQQQHIVQEGLQKIQAEIDKILNKVKLTPWFPVYKNKNRTITPPPPPTNNLQPLSPYENAVINTLKYTSIRNVNRRKRAEAKWTTEKIKEWRNDKKKQGQEKQKMKRATLGYIPQEVVTKLTDKAIAQKVPKELIAPLADRLNRIVISPGHRLYLELNKSNIERRKSEGVNMKELHYRHNKAYSKLSQRKLKIDRKRCKDCKWKKGLFCDQHSGT